MRKRGSVYSQGWRCWLSALWLIAPSVVLADATSVKANAEEESQPPTMVLIIDDMGLHWERGLQALSLPGPITYAFLPYRPHVKSLAQYAHRLHKEVMLHIPMSNTRQAPLGDGGLTPYQDERTFKARLRSALAAIPFVRGVNNHMGSQLTTHESSMKWVMETLRSDRYYFVDSRTTARSVAYRVAQERQIPSVARDVFLDHSRDPRDIHEQFKRAIRTAKTYGSAVVIAHPYPETIDYLKSAIPKLAYLGISQATVSGLLDIEAFDERIVHFGDRKTLPVDRSPLKAMDTLVEDIRRSDSYTQARESQDSLGQPNLVQGL